jgi:predicted nucleic acid-binding protein
MSVFVVDASVAAKWVFPESYTESSLRLLADRNRLHATDFLFAELDNVVCKRIRRGEINRTEGNRVREALRRFPIQTHSFLPLLDPGYELAVRSGRSLYDCLYVALAILLDGKMVTADRRLYKGLAAGPLSKILLWIEDL